VKERLRMNTRFLIHTILLAAVASSASAADLGAVYQRALANDPVIREAEANRRAARESKPQALAALLPQINATGRYNEEESDSTGAFVQPGLPPTPEVRDSDGNSSAWDVSLRQSVFRWQNWAALRRADAERPITGPRSRT
jgi:outer membrane protein